MKQELYGEGYYSRGGGNFVYKYLLDFFTWWGMLRFDRYFGITNLVLEIGCGDGKISDWLSHKDFQIDAVDVSQVAIARAKKQNNKVQYFWGDVFKLNGDSQKYDVVYSLHVMEHIKNVDENLEEINRILKDKGKLIIRIPNSDSFEARIAGKKWFHWDEPYHVNHWKYGEFKNVLIKNGFKNVLINFKLFEYKQVLLYSILSFFGLNMKSDRLRLLFLPLQIIFVPISIVLGFVFKNSGTVEIVARKF